MSIDPNYTALLDHFSEYAMSVETDDYPKNDFTQMQFKGPIDYKAIAEAYDEAVAKVPVFNCHLTEEHKGLYYVPKWIYDPEVKNRLIIEDCRHMAGDPFDPMDFSTRYYQVKTRRRIDLRREFPVVCYLLRVKDDEHIFSINFHHSAMDPLKGYILVTTMLERYHEMVKGEKPDWAGSLGMASLVRKEGYVKPISMLTFGREQITDVLIKNTNSKVANVATAQVKDPAECKGRHSLRAVIDDPKIVEGLFKRASRNQATVNDLVFACARKILTDWNRERGAKVGRFRFMLITSLAGRMPETKGEGAGLSGLNFVHKDPDADLDAMMRDFRDQRRNQLERGVDVQFNYTLRKIVQATRVLPLSKRTKLVRRLIERIPCTFYLSNLGTVWPKSKGSMESTIVKVGDFEINDMHSSASISRNLGLGLTIRSHNNRMYLNYVCDRFRFSLEEAKDITDRLTAEIIAAADPVE